jgi:ribose-phosphate pyrophosphokinase
LKVFSGSANPLLSREIAEVLGIPLGQARLRRFPDSEVSFQIDENIRGADVFIVQPTCNPVDPSLMELLVMIDAFRRSSAARITAVVPYYGYARQDRKDKPRVPISAKLVANPAERGGTNRVLTMDLHKAQIQGFFDIPVDHLFAAPGDHRLLFAAALFEPDDGIARRRWCRTRARLRQAAGGRNWRWSTSAGPRTVRPR